MNKFYEDEEINFEITFYSDKLKTTPVDPATIVLELTDPGGTAETVIVSQDGARPANVGKYTASYTVGSYGIWQWKWITQTPRIVRQGSFQVIKSNQND